MADLNINIHSNIASETDKAITSVTALKKAYRAAMNDAVAGTEGAAAKAAEYKERLKELNETTKSLQGSGVEKLTSSLALLQDGFASADPGKLGIAMRGLGAAMDAIPIFLLIEGLKLIWDNLDKVTSAFSTSEKKIKSMQDSYDSLIVVLTSHAAAVQREIDLLSAQGASEDLISEKKKEKIAIELQEAKAAYALSTAKILEIQQNDSLYESFLRLSIGISKFMGNEEAAEMQERALAINKKERAKDDLKAQNDAKEAILNAVNAQKVEVANVEKTASDDRRKNKIEETNIMLGLIGDEDEKEKALLKFKHENEIQEAVIHGGDLKSLKERQGAENIALDKAISDRAVIAQKEYWAQQAVIGKAAMDASANQQEQDRLNQFDRENKFYDELHNLRKMKAETALIGDKDNLAKKIELLEAQRIIEITAAEKTGGDVAAINDKYRKTEEQAAKDHADLVFANTMKVFNAMASATQGLISAISDYNQTIANEEIKRTEASLNTQLENLNEERDAELKKEGLTAAQKTAINYKYAVASYKLKLKTYNDETAIKKASFEQDKKLKVATAVISIITGALSTFASLAQLGPYGVIAGVVAAAAVVAAGAIEIAKINATTFDAGTPPAPPELPSPDLTGGNTDSSGRAAPNFNAFASTGNGQVNNQQTVTVKAVVIAQEVTDQQTQTTYSNNMGTL